MKREGWENRLSIPVHSSKTLKIGILHSLIKDAGITVDEFKQLL